MKISHTIIKLALASAGLLMVLLTLQACVTGRGLPFVHSFLLLSANRPVKIRGGERNFAHALRLAGKDGFQTHYCEKRPVQLICDVINPANLQEVLNRLRTDKVTKHARMESGGGDEMRPPNTEGMHVSQKVYFDREEDLKQFLNEISN